MKKGNVIIFGATGFLGRYLTRHYLDQGREVVAVARHTKGIDERAMFLEWDGRTPGPWSLALEGAALVINLTGKSVNCRYNKKNRREIMDSRIDSTRAIGEAIRACRVPPAVWMNASSATWYRHAEDRPQSERNGEPGEGFSVDVARAWEQSFFASADPTETRMLTLRIGMVLANEPGTVLNVLKRLTLMGLGGTMGDGNQRVSWIHMDDLIAAIDKLELAPMIDGAVNLVAPSAVTNRQLMSMLRESLKMPIGIPANDWMIKVGAFLLRTESELVLKSRWAEPRRLREMGFEFRWPSLMPALENLWARRSIAVYFDKLEHSPTVNIKQPVTQPVFAGQMKGVKYEEDTYQNHDWFRGECL